MKYVMIVVIMLNTMLFAGETKFQSTKAKTAQKNYKIAMDKLRAKYIVSLKYALKSTLKFGDLEESKRIDAEIKSLQSAEFSKFVGTLVKKDKPDTAFVISEDQTYVFKDLKSDTVWHQGNVVVTRSGFEIHTSKGKKIKFSVDKTGVYKRQDNKTVYKFVE